MIIKFLNGYKLLVANNSGEIVTAAEKLKAANIPYEYDTVKSKGLLMTRYNDMALQAQLGISQGNMGPSETQIRSYRLFVRKKDVKRAKEILEIN